MMYTPLDREYSAVLSGCHIIFPDSFSFVDKYLLYTLIPEILKIEIETGLLLIALNGITTCPLKGFGYAG